MFLTLDDFRKRLELGVVSHFINKKEVEEKCKYGMGAWTDFNKIDKIHIAESICEPVKENVKEYQKLLEVFKAAREYISIIGDRIVKEI